MNKKISQLLEPSFLLYYIFLILFALSTGFADTTFAFGQGLFVILLGLFYRRSSVTRRRAIESYIQGISGNIELATKDSTIHAPLPIVIFRPEKGDIVWNNDLFSKAIEHDEPLLDAKLSTFLPDFDTRWLMEGKTVCPVDVVVGERHFMVYGNLVRTSNHHFSGFLATTYWIDVTEVHHLRHLYTSSRPAAAIILVDNYDDLMRNLPENQSSAILSEISSHLGTWVEESGGILRRYARESYLLLIEQQHLDILAERKFDILEKVRQVKNASGIEATLSIGVGKDGETLEDLITYANLSIDMALSRGGDQVVMRNKFAFEFFGGRSAETEKRTKVKSRVMANALASLIKDSSTVFIMGHKVPDMDALGASAGVLALTRKLGKEGYIILAEKPSAVEVLYEKLRGLPEYDNKFISTQDALLIADRLSLLVVVDTNRPEQVESQALLESCNRVAVIDHHRRASEYIEGAALNYHELYASSASELVAELLQYTLDPSDLTRIEAEALLSGIVLDTKNFTLRTGGRTFEAAAFLRRCGADTGDVKRLFQNDFHSTVSRYNIIQRAELYNPTTAIAVAETDVGRVPAAQAADELLNIRGINTSFVLFPEGGTIIVSGRSMGDTNVQMILETLGGGGNAAASGAQVEGSTLEQTTIALTKALDDYFSHSTT
ncbi:MAG: DHH family phosphoesterase [Eubacteriales bacterium]